MQHLHEILGPLFLHSIEAARHFENFHVSSPAPFPLVDEHGKVCNLGDVVADDGAEDGDFFPDEYLRIPLIKTHLPVVIFKRSGDQVHTGDASEMFRFIDEWILPHVRRGGLDVAEMSQVDVATFLEDFLGQLSTTFIVCEEVPTPLPSHMFGRLRATCGHPDPDFICGICQDRLFDSSDSAEPSENGDDGDDDNEEGETTRPIRPTRPTRPTRPIDDADVSKATPCVEHVRWHLPCHHVFHSECLREYFGTKRRCPMCREDVFESLLACADRTYGGGNTGNTGNNDNNGSNVAANETTPSPSSSSSSSLPSSSPSSSTDLNRMVRRILDGIAADVMTESSDDDGGDTTSESSDAPPPLVSNFNDDGDDSNRNDGVAEGDDATTPHFGTDPLADVD